METFTIMSNEIEGRIDPHFYRPSFIRFYQQLEKTSFEIKTIGEIAEKVTSGATPKSKGDAYTSKDEGIPFIRSGDISEDKNINFDDVLYIKPEIHNKLLKGSKLKRGDVLIAIVGATIGQVSIYDYDREANINQAIALVRLKQGINPEYVKAFLLSSLGQKQLDRIKRPVARANINLDEIRSIKIIFPSLEIQNKVVSLMQRAYEEQKNKEKKISEFFDSINDYVLSELGIKLPELKDKMTFVVYADDVKGKRIDAYYYQPKFKEIEKAIEKGKFGITKGKEVFEKIESGKGISPEEKIEGGIPYIEVNHLTKIGIKETNIFVSPKSKPKLAEKEDILTGRVGSIGTFVIFNEDKKMAFSDNILRIKVKESLNKDYLVFVLNSSIITYQIDRSKKGSLQDVINQKTLENLKIPLPPIEIQNKIAEEVKRRMEKAEQLQKEAKEELEKAKAEVERMILG